MGLDAGLRRQDGAPQALRYAYHPSHAFSKEDTKSTKFGTFILRNLRVLRAFVVKSLGVLPAMLCIDVGAAVLQ